MEHLLRIKVDYLYLLDSLGMQYTISFVEGTLGCSEDEEVEIAFETEELREQALEVILSAQQFVSKTDPEESSSYLM